jgi:hypothetical protein
LNIHTLVQDIYDVVGSKQGWFDDALAEGFSRELGLKLVEKTKPRDEVPTLRLSQMGEVCPKQLWYSIHSPGSQEDVPPYVKIKFTYGDILESLLIAMAKAAGHEVTGEQDVVYVDGIAGHRDCVIDGYVVDVKSAASRPFQEIKNKRMAQDPFLSVYLDQLDGYLVGSADDPLVRVKDRGYILAIDKTLGHLTLYEHTLRDLHIRQRIKKYKEIINQDVSPGCECKTVADGKSGNIKLDTKASYSAYKHCCFPHLRTFLYSSGPVYLTKVVRKPDVPEVDRNGKIVYN